MFNSSTKPRGFLHFTAQSAGSTALKIKLAGPRPPRLAASYISELRFAWHSADEPGSLSKTYTPKFLPPSPGIATPDRRYRQGGTYVQAKWRRFKRGRGTVTLDITISSCRVPWFTVFGTSHIVALPFSAMDSGLIVQGSDDSDYKIDLMRHQAEFGASLQIMLATNVQARTEHHLPGQVVLKGQA